MRNVICPISDEKVLVNIPRINALLVVGLLVGYVLNSHVLLMIFLVIDFFMRGFLKGRKSPLAFISIKLHNLFRWDNEKRINKAPKIFAARLGFVFTMLILVFHVLQIPILVNVFSIMLIFFAFLECALNFCVGCWVFTLFVNPFYSKN